MAYELTNSLRSPSILRVVDGTVTLPITEFAKDANEVIHSVSIKTVNWSTNGSITITRDTTPVLKLHGNGEIRLGDLGHSIANNSTGNVTVTVASSGTAILEITKDTTYTTPIIGM
jgi:hypothetical protein